MPHNIKLIGTDDGTISVVKVNAPYGAHSEAVASIAISLKGNTEEVDWKVHIPMENIDDVIKALQSLKA